MYMVQNCHSETVCYTVQMWGARLALLVVMQQFREAEVEMEAFGELVNPDLFYQYHTHNYPDKTGQFNALSCSIAVIFCVLLHVVAGKMCVL